MIKAILWVWQLPQNLLGLLFRIILIRRIGFVKNEGTECLYHVDNMHGGLSLGRYVFVKAGATSRLKSHERGHSRQSRMLGPFYLIVIGITSFIWATCFKGYRKRYKVSYYDFYTEKWADNLGLKYDDRKEE